MNAGRKNVVILGSGRSGTSMMAGSLAGSGFYMGESLHPVTAGNPKGIFESWEVNSINEDILAQVTPKRPELGKLLFFRNRPRYMQRWLASVPVETPMKCLPAIRERIEKAVSKAPFCFKDPRFSYTLPVWRPFLQDTVFICVFRHPLATVSSMLKECEKADYLSDFSLTAERAAEIWTLMYRHILETHMNSGEWFFIHYDQLFIKEAVQKLENFLGIEIDQKFPDPLLERSSDRGVMSGEMREIYEELCDLADYDPNKLKKFTTEAMACVVS